MLVWYLRNEIWYLFYSCYLFPDMLVYDAHVYIQNDSIIYWCESIQLDNC